ncbi:MAG: protein kinase [Deltaproteobacteria bacterium]|nr:protein kinase [Deltaproteobacteria bacterium]
MAGGKSGNVGTPTPQSPPGATPIDVARASPTANPIKLAGDPILHPEELVGARYKVDALLGRGGFGDVYRAVHIGTHERVALKVLRPELLADATSVERFTHEARLSASLRSPNTVRVFDFGRVRDDGPLYLAMEYLEGDSLESIVCRDGPLEPRRAARLMVQMLKSLAEAHARKIVHRDLKPENIFVGTVAGETDFVHVIDFGIAKFVAEGQSPVLTQAGAILGTPHYMSPEQIRGSVLDSRADLYSAGVVLYRCLTGNHPFNGETTFGILAAHLQDDPPPIAMPGVDARLQAVVAKALHRERAHRYATADAFRAALEAWLASHPEVAAADHDDRTTLCDVLTPERLHASHERRIAAASQTVVAGVPSAPDAQPTDRHARPDHVKTKSDMHAIAASADDEATRLEIPSMAEPGQRGSHTAVIADVAAPLANLPVAAKATPAPRPRGPIAPQPASQAQSGRQRSSSAVASVPPVRPPSQPSPTVRSATADGDGQTVSMDVVAMGLTPDPEPPGGDTAVAALPVPRAVSAPLTKPVSSANGLRLVVAFGLAFAAVAVALWWSGTRSGEEPAVAPARDMPGAAAATPNAEGDPAPDMPAASAPPPPVAAAAPAAVGVAASATPETVAVTAAAPPTPESAPPVEAPAAPAEAPVAPQKPVAVKPAPPAGATKVAKAAKPPADASEAAKAAKAAKPAATCSAPEGSPAWCNACPAAQGLPASSKHFCPCLVARGQNTGLNYYCKCVFPKESHKIGSPAFCRCNPRDLACLPE